jgi:23S rRNA (guanine2445-N2)-methyltransferase / 23S rRNA (guanine2069-N7)-methyltransferase
LQNVPVLLGFDYDKRVIEKASVNADRAGLQGKVQFIYQDIYNFRHDFPAHGLMVTNPPYGVRLNESGELPALYTALGEVMKSNLIGWRGAVFTEDQSLGKHLGMRAQKLHTLYNGAIVCKLIHFSIEESQFYRDNRLPRRVADEELSEQAAGFRNRLQKNLKQLSRWAKKQSVSCYRVYDADLPDYSAAIDLYTSADSPEERWICIQEYEAPETIDPVKAKFRTRELVTICQAQFEVDDAHLIYKTRSRQRGESQYQRVENTENFHLVSEGSAKLWVNFEDYLDTGLFLDHRPIRLKIAGESKDKDFLNLFAYTGAATVHAGLGGAKSTTTVDMSNTYLEWAGRNLAANGLNTDRHQLVQADCLQWLASQTERYDLIFLDPPTFSNSKRMTDAFDVQQDQISLVRGAMSLLRKGGVLYFSTNLRNFRLNPEIESEFSPENITTETIPFDFKRRQNIHHCWRFGSPNQ